MLSLTPLDEAWNIVKFKKSKENKYAKPDVQNKILNTKPQQIVLPNYDPDIGGPLLPISKPSLLIKINNPDIINRLKPFKEEYISDLVVQALIQFHKPKEVVAEPVTIETFENEHDDDNDNTLCFLTIMLILLLIIDMIVRIKKS
tara:strand:+ start:3911 stop:4345 length:435 start_codon:yes stop_codon:yes gene_type:complete